MLLDVDPRLEFRCDLIRVLLRTRNDYLPAPRGSSVSTQSGVAPGRRVPCSDCLRSGKVKRDGRVVMCLVCDGTGWRRRRAGDKVWDEYTGTLVGSADDKPSTLPVMTSAQLDHELARLRAAEADREGRVAVDESYGWERAREHRDLQGSYAVLDRALERLGQVDPDARYALFFVYDSPISPVSITGRIHALECQGVEWLAKTIKGQIRVPRHEYAHLREQQRARIRLMAEAGLLESEIAETVGVSRRFVRSALQKPPLTPGEAGTIPSAS